MLSSPGTPEPEEAGRKIARELGRQVRIEVSGENTELDKLIVEDLADPLMHLIRNAIDLGIRQIPSQGHPFRRTWERKRNGSGAAR